MPIVSPDALRRLAFDVFAATGIPAADARIVADHLVNSHLAGHDSHGTWFLPSYARSMKQGYVPWEDRQVVRETMEGNLRGVLATLTADEVGAT